MATTPGASVQARTHSKDHSPHVTDERFNTASHLIAGIFALLGSTWLIVEASIAGSPWHIVTFSIYGASLIALFSASALHHGIDGSDKVEEMLRSIDYMGIYLLIAGTMTPVCLAL
ncbi:MAG: hemolysin III, partial [Kiritimatiellia bacterium]